MTMPEPRGGRLVRSYVITGGRARANAAVDVVTLLLATGDTRPLAVLPPEKRRIVELCRGGALLSLAEVAGHLDLAVSLTRVLVADLINEQMITTRSTPVAQRTDRALLQEVLDGLKARL